VAAFVVSGISQFGKPGRSPIIFSPEK